MKTMKRADIRPCDLCCNPLCHTQVPLFWRVQIERMGIDLKVARELDGLTALLGSSQMAEVFAPSTELVRSLHEIPDELLICERCALSPDGKPLPVAVLAEIASEGKAKREASQVSAA